MSQRGGAGVRWAEPELGRKPWSGAGKGYKKMRWPCIVVLVSLGWHRVFSTPFIVLQVVPPPRLRCSLPKAEPSGGRWDGAEPGRVQEVFLAVLIVANKCHSCLLGLSYG